jgi:MFS family permease
MSIAQTHKYQSEVVVGGFFTTLGTFFLLSIFTPQPWDIFQIFRHQKRHDLSSIFYTMYYAQPSEKWTYLYSPLIVGLIFFIIGVGLLGHYTPLWENQLERTHPELKTMPKSIKMGRKSAIILLLLAFAFLFLGSRNYSFFILAFISLISCFVLFGMYGSIYFTLMNKHQP